MKKKPIGRPSKMRNRDVHDVAFCHDDLSACNVIIDAKSLKVKALVEWEYAGF